MLSRINGGCYIKPLCSPAYFFSRNRCPYRGVNLLGFLRETPTRIQHISTISFPLEDDESHLKLNPGDSEMGKSPIAITIHYLRVHLVFQIQNVRNVQR